MKIGTEVTFELYQFWCINPYDGKYEEEKFQYGIQFDSPKNFFKTLSENHKKKSGAYAIRPYELRRVVKFYNMEDWVIMNEYDIIKQCGDESKVPLHVNWHGMVVDPFRLIGSVVTDRFNFFVRNSLEYAKDIAPFMAKNFSDKPFYCIGKDYDNIDKDKPLLFSVGYYYGPEKYAVNYTYLPDAWDKPVVITPDGYQLWPQVAKKKRPDIFKQILFNKKEEINIRSF